MIPRLSPGPDTFTRAKVLAVLRKERSPGRIRIQIGSAGRYAWALPNEFEPRSFAVESVVQNGVDTRHYLDPEQQAQKKQEFCKNELFPCLDGEDYVLCLDAALSSLLKCNFELRDKSEDQVVEQACQLLARMPRQPPEMVEASMSDYRCIPTCMYRGPSERDWESLGVTTFVSRNVIRLALHLATSTRDFNSTSSILSWIDVLGDILATIHEILVQSHTTESARQKWFVLESFIWTQWHRCVLPYLSYHLQIQIKGEFVLGRRSLEFKNATLISELSRHGKDLERLIPPYMCRWAYESIRTDRASTGLDLRTFLARYREFTHSCGPDRSLPVCLKDAGGSAKQCDGISPAHCRRFANTQVENQSMHDVSCSGQCRRLFWCKDPYLIVKGARAVSLSPAGTDGLMRYIGTSESTMAVSHVWSHGQGGRPDTDGPPGEATGFNECLHLRYSSIARANGCDSYWMDTPCIPSDKRLKKEAIGQINRIFQGSKMTLVCDRDIMQIDIQHMTMEVKEMILATLLACDWNIRAWTLLEAMRGRTNLHLLCKDNLTVSLESLINDVNKNGSIELAVLLLTSQHLVPFVNPHQIPERTSESNETWNLIHGYLSTIEAGCLLSRRHTSHPQDELIIWSLLCGTEPTNNPVTFWKSRIEPTYWKFKLGPSEGGPRRGGPIVDMGSVTTGFLVSSAPRVSASVGEGFSWAPSRSGCEQTRSGGISKVLDGNATAPGFFTVSGLLEGEWLMHTFLCDPQASSRYITSLRQHLRSRLSRHATHEKGLLWEFQQQLSALGYCSGALLQAAAASGLDAESRSVASMSDSGRVLVVLVGSRDTKGEAKTWEWVETIEWDPAEPLPRFERKVIMIK